jgi:hypothetical protein
MSAFKQFLSQDLIVEPFKVNKGFSFPSSEFNDNNVQISRFTGENIKSPIFISGSNTPTGNSSVGFQDPELMYNSVKELYYSNFLTSSYGSPVQTQSMFPGENEDGNVFVGNSDSSGRYENYLQSTDDVVRFFPTGSNNKVAILSIPSLLWGDYIQPNSFEYKVTDSDDIESIITDDGNGNLYLEGDYVGNIIYPHGIAIFTKLSDNGSPGSRGYGISEYGLNVYGGGISIADLFSTNVTCSFTSSFDIYETQYKATISENEFNFSQNPSIISGSTEGTLYDFTTGSFFEPYITTVGLYDDAQNLLAVGKLSQPLPLSRTVDTTIFINIDR